MRRHPTIQQVRDLAGEAGAIILDSSRKLKTVTSKSSVADLVTEFDLAVESFLKARISETFPDHLFLAEESSADDSVLTDAPTWIIDPIDGTTNFIHGFPFFCVSIAFSAKKQILHGVVFNPVTDQMYYASKGFGAFVSTSHAEPRRLVLNGESDLSSALISTGFNIPTIRSVLGGSPDKKVAADYALLQKVVLDNVAILQTKCRDIRRIGSAALDLCAVAAGITDCYYEFGVREWDIAAGLLILEEAGGVITNVAGNPLDLHGRNILACNSQQLQKQTSSLLINFDWNSHSCK